MRYTILVLAMLAVLAVMALPAIAQSRGGYDDYGRGGYNDYDRGHDDGKYDDGKYDDDYWWHRFIDEDTCGVYQSFWGPQYWCWSPLFGWIQLG